MTFKSKRAGGVLFHGSHHGIEIRTQEQRILSRGHSRERSRGSAHPNRLLRRYLARKVPMSVLKQRLAFLFPG